MSQANHEQNPLELKCQLHLVSWALIGLSNMRIFIGCLNGAGTVQSAGYTLVKTVVLVLSSWILVSCVFASVAGRVKNPGLESGGICFFF